MEDYQAFALGDQNMGSGDVENQVLSFREPPNQGLGYEDMGSREFGTGNTVNQSFGTGDLADQGFGTGNTANQVWESKFKQLQHAIEQQNKRLEQQDRRLEQQEWRLAQQENRLLQQNQQINELTSHKHKSDHEHNMHKQVCRLQTQQFTMHIQSHQLWLQQLFAMQSGGPGKHIYGPPPLPTMVLHPMPSARDMSRNLGGGATARRERSQRLIRDRSRSPDRGDDRYPEDRREYRSHRSDGVGAFTLDLPSRESNSMSGSSGGGEMTLDSMPIRLKDNARVDGRNSQAYSMDLLANVKDENNNKLVSGNGGRE